jgi:endogenous inhibitor of DNA gyrase (YacG/DUF329 family)
LKHRCSICGTTYEFEYEKGQKLPPNFPFCSARCKAIDLGKWFNEEYRISTTVPGAEEMSETEKEILAQFLLDTGEVDEVIDGNES